MITPPASGAPPIVWAVFLGADTANRLALEWGVSRANAFDALRKAAELGLIRVVGKRRGVVPERRLSGKRWTSARIVNVYGLVGR